MDAWQNTGRPALFDALANACDQIGVELEAGMIN